MNEYLIRRPIITDVEEVVTLSGAITDKYIEHRDEWKAACEYHIENKSYLVAAADSKILGYACIRPDIPRQPWSGKYRLQIGVNYKYRRKGIGHRLIDAIIDELQIIKANIVRVRVIENNEVDFFTKMGFAEYERMVRLRADVAEIETSSVNSLLNDHRTRGITISTLDEELKQMPDFLMKLYEFEREIYKLFLNTDPVVPISYKDFCDTLNQMKDLHNGYFIAKDGSDIIGCCYVMYKTTDPNGLIQGLTGVLSSHQKQGIATVLKYCTIQYAKQNNYQYIETSSLGHNEKMLKVQRKVGFTVKGNEIRLEKKFE